MLHSAATALHIPPQLLQPSGDAPDAHLQLQVGDQGAQVGVAAALPDAKQRPLDLAGTSLHGRQGAGDGAARVVVGVDGDAVFREGGDDVAHSLLDLVGKASSPRLAQHEDLGSRLRSHLQAAHGIVPVLLPAVEEVLGVEEDPLALANEPGD